MNRRYFLNRLASGIVAAVAPAIFVPKLIKPSWSGVTLQTPVKPVFDAAAPEGESTLLCFVNFKVAREDEGVARLEIDQMSVPIRVPNTCSRCGKLLDDCQCIQRARVLSTRTYRIEGGKVEITEGPAGHTVEVPKISYTLESAWTKT